MWRTKKIDKMEMHSRKEPPKTESVRCRFSLGKAFHTFFFRRYLNFPTRIRQNLVFSDRWHWLRTHGQLPINSIRWASTGIEAVCSLMNQIAKWKLTPNVPMRTTKRRILRILLGQANRVVQCENWIIADDDGVAWMELWINCLSARCVTHLCLIHLALLVE